MTIGGSPIGGSPIGGGAPLNADPPPGLGINVTATAATGHVSVSAGGPTANIGAGAVTAEVSVTGELSATIVGGPVLGVFRDRAEQIDSILSGLDDESVTDIGRLIKDVVPFAEIDASPEEQWRQFMASTVADTIREATAPLMEQIQSQQAHMDDLFGAVFAIADALGDRDQPPLEEDEVSPQEIKNWSAIIMFWIASAAAGYWIGSSFHMGTIFAALGFLLALWDHFFK